MLALSPDADIFDIYLAPVACNPCHTRNLHLWNEKEQLSRRYVKFNLAELVRIATRATGSMSCVEVQMLPEGNFNKVFLLTMNNRKEVIAKLPNPNAGPQYFTTASEVGTMDYVRNILRIPAPIVYAWSPSTEEIGAEYIIMEKSQGVELSKLWDGIPGPDKLQIVQQLVEFEKALVSTRFPMYGSLYYAKDLQKVQSNQMIDIGIKKRNVGLDFAVGPTTKQGQAKYPSPINL
ncbi:Aminoglycoside phosphotransferase [Penicillium samsonianum]|uniref:Aminoglycoside phosphotransferase n=1 Tax=Penicillium samsonianum TaxID=1882272 RepID=UPI002548B2FE|nr:Aminoglycoside phosphotransferase [Penicillium samsonianum]KAJ6149594.1 Aminoglycoside phosphotransferase [Penicillium samsonianum]